MRYLRSAFTLCISFLVLFLITTVSYSLTVTNINDSGPGSLRDAIVNTPAGGTVDFAVTGTIALLSELVVDKDLTIEGPGANRLTLDGGGATRIMVISDGTDVTISGLRFTNGNGAGSIVTGLGSAILMASESLNMELDDCVFDNNTNSRDGYNGIITYYAYYISLTVNRCVFMNNTAHASSAIYAVIFGSAYALNTLVVNDSTFKTNVGQVDHGLVLGGVVGLVSVGNDYKFNNCTFDSNIVSSENIAIGGVLGDAVAENNIEFTNCTFNNNRAECSGYGCEAHGGAIGSEGSSHITCNFCTFASDRVSCTGTNCTAAGDEIAPSQSTEISNSIIRGDDPANNCGNTYGYSVVSLGYNIDNGNSCVDGSVTGDKPFTDPDLNPRGLRDNGGFTETIALLPQSPAVDMASPACPPPFTDQRGVERPQQTACDIGAYELVAVVRNIPTLSEGGLLGTAVLLGIIGLLAI